jgi:hypothetical protein
MVTKAKLAAGLAGVGVAVVVAFPAPAGATICVTECGGGGPGSAGLTNALTALTTNPSNNVVSGDPDEGGRVAVFDRLAGNHNETVLTLA